MQDEELELPEHWSPEAKQHYLRVVQELRVQGMGDEFLESMKEAMEQFYDPETGLFQLDNFDDFFEAMIDGLLGSDMLHSLIAASDILDEPEFMKFRLTPEEIAPCIEEWSQWVLTEIAPRDDINAADVLLDESLEDERDELGEILYEHYQQTMQEEAANELYNALYEYARASEDDEEREMAKTAMTSFNTMPGLTNPMVQFLFVKSLIQHSHIRQDVAEMSKTEEEASEVLEMVEDSLFAMLADAEEFDAMYEQDEWEDEHWEDEDDDEDWKSGGSDDDVPF